MHRPFLPTWKSIHLVRVENPGFRKRIFLLERCFQGCGHCLVGGTCGAHSGDEHGRERG